MNKELEYQSLRRELLNKEKYTLERPMTIFLIGFSIFCTTDGIVSFFIPSVILVLLIVNLNWTLKRLEDAIKIRTYIAIALEKNISYIGWENFLSVYREKREVVAKDYETIENLAQNKKFHATINIHHFLSFLTLCLSIGLIGWVMNAENDISTSIQNVGVAGIIINAMIFLSLLFANVSVERLAEFRQMQTKEKYIVSQILNEINNPKNPTA